MLQRGTAEQWIKEGKNAIKWTGLSCRTFAANAVRLQLHALAYNLGNLMRTLAMRKAERPWSLTSVREAGKDRRQGRQPRALRRRGRGAATDVRRDPVADRPAAGTARAGMSGAGSLCGKRRQERYASVCAIQRFGALDRRIRAPFASGYGDLPLPKPVKGAILSSKTPGSGEYRVSRSCPPGSATD
jgi:hypothetical protein